MDFEKLLGGIDCECGRRHTCPIKKIVIRSGALEEIPALAENYSNIVLAADTNTYRVCGAKVRELLGEKVEACLVYEREGVLVPNEEAIDELSAVVSEKTDLIIGVGSGVIQDLCKYVSFEKKLPYHIVATAPSMDGYASVGAAMITSNMKITYSAHVPEAIVGDTEILKDAPMDMIKSGWGDIVGKYSCLNDWKLARLLNGEYFCDYIYNLTYQMVLEVRDLAPKLLTRDAEAVGKLTEALIGVGIAMAYSGNSRPASGSEHHLSHFFEIVGIVKDEPYLAHGLDVVYSTVRTEMMREELIGLESCPSGKPFERETWEKEIRRIYGRAAEGVIELQTKLGWYERDLAADCAEKWDEIKKTLAEVPSSEELKKLLKTMELDYGEYVALYGEQKLDDAVRYAKDLKDRFTVLWVYEALMNK